ncbi:MAG: pyruvate ferredoxin oxidoreductase [Candidatus Falkowbacteria bacterium]
MPKHDKLKILEGSRAIAMAVAACRPGVVAAFPITPQTHIVEDLARFKAQGTLDCQFLRAESETAAASMVLGAAAAGERAYTATSSQGLLHMLEVVYNIAGLELPVVMTLANRSLSAPINIWNDLSDAMAMRDAGWLMLFAESAQEAIDMHIIAFRLAAELQLPVAVNVDGFLLTHTSEPACPPDSDAVQKFLGPKLPPALQTSHPRSLGTLADTEQFQGLKLATAAKLTGADKLINKVFAEYYKTMDTGSLTNYSSTNNGLLEWYGPKKAQTAILVTGSVAGTFKTSLQENHPDIALIRLKTFRPFPEGDLKKLCSGLKNLAVLDRAISNGAEAPLTAEVKAALYGSNLNINSMVCGLGGKTISQATIAQIIKMAAKKISKPIIIDL